MSRSKDDRSLDFEATTGLHGALRTKPVSYAKDVQGNREALERAKYRTAMSDARWVPKKDHQQAETDVRFLTKTAWHIGAGYNIGAGFATQHGWDALGTNAGKGAPRVYEYAGLSFKNYTSSSGPLMQDVRKDNRVSGMLDSLKVRHDEAIAECEKTLDLLNDSLEPVVMELIKSVQGRLTENVDTIEELFMQLADEFLTRIDMAQLQGVWSDYQEQSMLREVWIAEFEEQTAQLEEQRAGLVQAELQALGQVLLDIGHQLRGPIERYLEKEAHKHNLVVLNNRRAYADMCKRLRRKEIERDKKARVRWEGRKHAWYLTLHDRAVAKCRATLLSKPYATPKKRDTLYGALRSQQTILFERRVNIWMDAQSLVPPDLTREKAEQWSANMAELDKEQDLEHKQRCGAIRKFEMEHHLDSQKVIEALKKELKGYAEMTDAPMPSEEELREASQEFENLILERRDKGLEAVGQCTETLALQLAYLSGPGTLLGKLLRVVADLTTVQAGRVTTEREGHSTAMARLREEHENNDLKLEDEHEYLVTQMRQEKDEASLRALLPQALEALDRIKAEYRRYYDAAMDQTRAFDAGMQALLKSIDDMILSRLDLSNVDDPTPPPAAAEAPPAGEPRAEGEGGEDAAPVAPVVYDDEEATTGEEIDFVTLKSGRSIFVRDRRAPEHANDVVGIMAIPIDTAEEIEAARKEEELRREEAMADEPPGDVPPAGAGADDTGDKGEGGEDEEEREPPFVADAMVSPLNPFSAWGNEPLLEIVEIPTHQLVEVRRAQRRALLEHKAAEDSEVLEATDRTVREQQETLTVQLDELLRQWAPRPGRAEMDVYEVRDTQLHQHQSRTDRHVGALSVRAAAQQSDYTQALGRAEAALKAHCIAQRQRVKSLEVATNTSQLANYSRVAKLESAAFCEAVGERVEAIERQAHEALVGLQRMNKQYLDSCYLFEALGGPKGKDGTYNPEEVAAYRERLAVLDGDAEARCQAWVKYAKEMGERHVQTSGEELTAFNEAITNVEADITLLEAVDKEMRACSLQLQQEHTRNDAAIEALDQRLIKLEGLCAGYSGSTISGALKSQGAKATGKSDEEEEAEEALFQGRPASVEILQTLASIRWRVRHRATYMQCLQSTLAADQVGIVPPPTEPVPAPPAPPEGADPPSEPVAALRTRLFPPPPAEGEAGGADAADAADAPPAAAAPARFPLLDPDETADEEPGTFAEAAAAIQEQQAAALRKLVESYFESLGGREITRKEGDPACTAERFIPPSAEEYHAKNDARLAELAQQTQQALRSKTRYLRSVVAAPPPSLPYKVDTSRPSLRTNWTRLVPLTGRGAHLDGGWKGARGALPQHRGAGAAAGACGAQAGGGGLQGRDGGVAGGAGAQQRDAQALARQLERARGARRTLRRRGRAAGARPAPYARDDGGVHGGRGAGKLGAAERDAARSGRAARAARRGRGAGGPGADGRGRGGGAQDAPHAAPRAGQERVGCGREGDPARQGVPSARVAWAAAGRARTCRSTGRGGANRAGLERHGQAGGGAAVRGARRAALLQRHGKPRDGRQAP